MTDIKTRERSAERKEFLGALLTTAIEGGVNYWAQVVEYKWDCDEPYAVLVDCEEAEEDEPERLLVDLDVIARGINKIASGEVGFYNMGYEGDSNTRMLVLNRTNGTDDRLGDYDALDADAVVQAGLFGEIVFG